MNKFKVGDMVHLNGDTRVLTDRRNEARVCEVTNNFYIAECMSNGNKHSYYEEQLTAMSWPRNFDKDKHKAIQDNL